MKTNHLILWKRWKGGGQEKFELERAFDRSADLGEAYVAPKAVAAPKAKQFRCKVCGYIYEGEELPEKYVCPLCKRPANMFEEVK